MEPLKIGFIGTGGIARAHAYALEALKYYYDDAPPFVLQAACSRTASRCEAFAQRFGFAKSLSPDAFAKSHELDAVWIMGPNKVHLEHLEMALAMPAVRYIYLEKPVCASELEEKRLEALLADLPPETTVQVGFQFLQTSGLRAAWQFWEQGSLGSPLHFDIKYYHGDYLAQSYRDKRRTRLTPAPDGGAMADLGSHALSLAISFFGRNLQLLQASQAGAFPDVPPDSDLFSSLSLLAPQSGAVGQVSASRISAGTGDLISIEAFGQKGALRFNSQQADEFSYYLTEADAWTRKMVGSRYAPISSFPSGHVPPGWLRALVHAHYLFLSGDHRGSFVPDLAHGLAVQRLVRETAEGLAAFRVRRDALRS